jgi:predicted PurR-regulated permease PerM
MAWMFSNIFFYFVIAVVIATILKPLTNYINQTQFVGLRIPRYFAVIISFSILIGVISLFVILFIPVVSAQVEVLSEIDYKYILDQLSQPFQRFENFMIENDLTDRTVGFLSEELNTSFRGFISNTNFTDIINNVLSYTGQFIIGMMAVLFISFFMLYEDSMIRRNFVSLIPNSYFEMVIAAIAKIEMLLSNYLAGLLIQMISIFTLAAVGLSIIDVKFALTIALFAAVANLIPYLGPILGATFGIIISVSTAPAVLNTPNEYLLLSFKILFVFAIVQLIDNLVLQPLIFSKSVRAHPLEIFVVIFAGASLAQIPGMIAAIPTYTILRVSIKELYSGYKQYKIFTTS